MSDTSWIKEIENGKRFRFGANWKNFVKDSLDEESITNAYEATKESIVDSGLDFKNMNVIDVGCGSGLFSLVALKLGAKHVTSFDYDSDSLECTKNLLDKSEFSEDKYSCIAGSILDEDFVNSLGKFDLVYSWGVLHHTGNLNKAIENASKLVKSEGFIFISLYQQTFLDPLWRIEKKFYSSTNNNVRFLINKLWIAKTKLSFKLKKKSFTEMINSYKTRRGMNYYKNLIDWLGGYPYQGIKPKKCSNFFERNGFKLIKQNIVSNFWDIESGCNEYIFRKI